MRPLDGNCDGTPEFDIGAYEFIPDCPFRIASISNGPPVTVYFLSSTNRLYTLSYCTRLLESAPAWTNVSGQIDVPGHGGIQALRDTSAVPPRFYRVAVRSP